MCVIIAKRRGIALPENIEKIYNSCWLSNDDGAGFAIKRAGSKTIEIDKGYMSPEPLIKALKKAKVQQNDELMVHFRVATNGGRGPNMTHPFIVTTDHKLSMRLNAKVSLPVVAHNGIMNEQFLQDKQLSDSYLFATKVLGGFNPKAGNSRKGRAWRDKLRKIIQGQRLCIMFPDKEMELLGHFYYYKQLFFSNSMWKGNLFSTIDNGIQSAAYKHCGYPGLAPTSCRSDQDDYDPKLDYSRHSD